MQNPGGAPDDDRLLAQELVRSRLALAEAMRETAAALRALAGARDEVDRLLNVAQAEVDASRVELAQLEADTKDG